MGIFKIRCSIGVASNLFLALALQGCSPRSSEISPKSLKIFSDFTFVGAGPYKPPASGVGTVNEAVAKHGISELPLPDRPQVGIQYIFHHRGPVDNEKLALVDLPARLRSAGIVITKSPRSNRDLMYLYIGGPAFKISIEENGHRGIIYNEIDPDLREDYVLLWLK